MRLTDEKTKSKTKQNTNKKRSFFWGKFVLSQLVVSGLNGKKNNVQQTFVYLKLKSANFTLLQMVWRIFFERYTYTCNCEQVIFYAGKYSPRFIFAPFCPRCRCVNWTLGEFHCLKLYLFLILLYLGEAVCKSKRAKITRGEITLHTVQDQVCQFFFLFTNSYYLGINAGSVLLKGKTGYFWKFKLDKKKLSLFAIRNGKTWLKWLLLDILRYRTN